MSEATPLLELRGVRAAYDRIDVLFGVDLAVSPQGAGGRRVVVPGGRVLHAADLDVPGDLSAASFLLAAAAAQPGAEVTCEGVNVNPTRAGLLDVIAAMGAEVVRTGQRVSGVSESADGAAALLVDGTSVDGDVVIGCIAPPKSALASTACISAVVRPLVLPSLA